MRARPHPSRGARRVAHNAMRGAFPIVGAACAMLAATLVFSCGGNAPEIALVEWRVELRPSKEGAYESLSAFASLRDEDGIDDIVELHLVHDGESFAWSLTNAEWTKRREGADDWIGAAGLTRPDYGPMPRGEYRIVAVDAAGESVERIFGVEGAFPSLAAPEIGYERGTATLRSSWPENLVLGYDATGALVAQAAWIGKAESLQDLYGEEPAARIAEIAAYGYDPSRRMGAYSWKKKTR